MTPVCCHERELAALRARVDAQERLLAEIEDLVRRTRDDAMRAVKQEGEYRQAATQRLWAYQ